MYSVDTRELGKDLLVLVSSRQHVDHPDAPGRPWWRLSMGPFALKHHLVPGDLIRVTELLDLAYALVLNPGGPAESEALRAWIWRMDNELQ